MLEIIDCPLVSVVVPCYNVENKIPRLLESIARQTYKRLELIFVNDGSSDNTEEVIFEYKPVFEEQGMIFEYIKQENKGPGGAVCTGFHMASGEYLIWPDADDWLEDNSVEERLDFLEANKDYSCVSSDIMIYSEMDLEHPTMKMSDIVHACSDENQFEHLLNYESVFCPGAHMIRMKSMLSVNPDRYLYSSRAGQNIQLLLPISYRMKRAYIDKCLYNYVQYGSSLSREAYSSLDRGMREIDELEKIYRETLSRMPIDGERERIEKEVTDVHLRNKYYLVRRYCALSEEKTIYRLLKRNKALTRQIVRMHYFRFLWEIKDYLT